MKRIILSFISILLLCGYSSSDFDIDSFDQYDKEYQSEEYEVCSSSDVKTYESYRAITNTASKQYEIISKLTIDDTTGFLYYEDGFIAVALGSHFGALGSRYYITLSSGNVIPIIKADAKSDHHVEGGCSSAGGSVIEFIIDEQISREYFGQGPSGLASYGNFNNYPSLNGTIVKIEKVLDTKIEEGIYYEELPEEGKVVNLNDITY